jgi:hypothetical protein
MMVTGPKYSAVHLALWSRIFFWRARATESALNFFVSNSSLPNLFTSRGGDWKSPRINVLRAVSPPIWTPYPFHGLLHVVGGKALDATNLDLLMCSYP